MSLFSKPIDPTPEEASRALKVTQRAIEVHGNDFHASMWLSEKTPMRPGKTWMTRIELARDSVEGLQEVLELLDEAAKTVIPQPLPASIRAARNGRRVRRKKSDFK